MNKTDKAIKVLAGRAVKVTNPEEKRFLMGFMRDVSYINPNYLDYCWFRQGPPNNKLSFYGKKEGEDVMSFDEFRMAVSDYDVTVKFTIEEFLFLRCLFGGLNIYQLEEIMDSCCSLVKEKLKCISGAHNVNSIKHKLFVKIDELYEKNHAKIQQLAAENKEISFSNGKSTKKRNDGLIEIGCWTKSRKDWLEYVEKIIDIAPESINIEGLNFTLDEVKKFRKYLIEDYKN